MGPPTRRPIGPKLGYRLLKKPPILHCEIAFHIVKRLSHTAILATMRARPYNHNASMVIWTRGHCGIMEGLPYRAMICTNT
jgi:hypothetical protein